MKPTTIARVIELVVVFGLIPSACILSGVHGLVVPLLLVMGGYCLWVLRRDPSFDRSVWRWPAGLGREFLKLLPAAIVGAAAMALLVWWIFPELWLALPRDRPGLWLAVMVLYPLISVVPQELIYRAFFLHRYDPLFRSPLVANLTSAALFGLHHYVFHNWVAVGLTLVGGLKFTLTYRRSRSLPLVCIEHALYGCLVFTVGLGVFFYGGSLQTIGHWLGERR